MLVLLSVFVKRSIHLLTMVCCLTGLARAAGSTESWQPRFPSAQGLLAYDTDRHETVELLQGSQGAAETWVWNGSTWNKRFPTTEPDETAGAITYDAARKQVVLFTYGGSTNVSETWVWDGTNWAKKSPQTSPSSRSAHSIAYDPKHKKVLLFGGAYFEGSPIFSDTWLWDGTNWTQQFPANDPPARYNSLLVYDDAARQMVLFGGYPNLNDTWIWDGVNWTQQSPQTSPPVSGEVSGAYDASHQLVFLLDNNQSWVWDGTDWTQKTPANSPSSINSMAYDPGDRRILMPLNSTNGLATTWLWDGSNWTSETPGPLPRSGQGLSTTASGKAILFGGASAGGFGLLADTWLWNGKNWKQEAPGNSPSARKQIVMAFDEAHHQVLLFGGSSSGGLMADTWVWANGNWTMKNPRTSPAARSSYCMAYDPVHQQVILFGGAGTSTTLADTWVWDGRDWEAKSVMNPPPARQGCGLSFDPVSQQTILFGGLSGSTTYGDTWGWNGSSWVQKSPSASPSPRFGEAMALDPTSRQIVLFGGEPGTVFSNADGDTWTWNGTTWVSVTTASGPPARYSAAMTPDFCRHRLLLTGGLVNPLPFNNDTFGDTWLLGIAPAEDKDCMCEQ